MPRLFSSEKRTSLSIYLKCNIIVKTSQDPRAIWSNDLDALYVLKFYVAVLRVDNMGRIYFVLKSECVVALWSLPSSGTSKIVSCEAQHSIFPFFWFLDLER